MQVIAKSIDDIKPYENNPRDNEDAVDKVAESIKQYGFQQPLVIDKNSIIVVGHTRYLAAKKLGIKEVPVKYAKHDDGTWLTKDEVKAYRIADNKTADFSVWDNKKLLDELNSDDLIKSDFFTGFDESDIFDDVLDETDTSPLDETENGIVYTLNFKTQNKALYEKVKKYIDDEQEAEDKDEE